MNAHAEKLLEVENRLKNERDRTLRVDARFCYEAAAEIERLEAERDSLRQALQDISRYGGTLPSDNEMGLSCNGTWCAEQARAALAGKDTQ